MATEATRFYSIHLRDFHAQQLAKFINLRRDDYWP